MLRILVVDDSPAMRAYVRGALEEAPPGTFRRRGAPSSVPPSAGGDELEIVEAASGFDALRLLPRGRFDLVVADINMPDINGLELVRFVRESEHHRRVPVLIISTQGAERDALRGLALGANGFLAKPFTPEAVRASVAASLAGEGAAVDER